MTCFRASLNVALRVVHNLLTKQWCKTLKR